MYEIQVYLNFSYLNNRLQAYIFYYRSYFSYTIQKLLIII
jgi:hypothetical protein